jgi:hypothetical protein
MARHCAGEDPVRVRGVDALSAQSCSPTASCSSERKAPSSPVVRDVAPLSHKVRPLALWTMFYAARVRGRQSRRSRALKMGPAHRS